MDKVRNWLDLYIGIDYYYTAMYHGGSGSCYYHRCRITVIAHVRSIGTAISLDFTELPTAHVRTFCFEMHHHLLHCQ